MRFSRAVDLSSEPDVDPPYEIVQPTMVPHRTKWKRHHDSEYGFDLKIAQDTGLICWQTLSNAIVSKWNKKFRAKFRTGLGKPDAHTAKFVPRIDERHQGPGRNPYRRKSEEMDLSCFAICFEPSRQGELGGRNCKTTATMSTRS